MEEDAKAGGRSNWWLVAAIAVGFAVLGFLSSVGLPEFFGASRPAAEVKPGPAASGDAVPPAPEPATSPLGFLAARLEQKPSGVDEVADEAKEVTRCLVEGFPNDPGSHDMAARLHRLLGYSEEAVKAWDRSLALNANYSHGYEGLASVAARKGEKEKAVHLLRRALVLRPESFDSQVQLAQALIDLNRMEEAVRLLEINVAADPRPYRGRVLLGMAYTHLGDHEKAKLNYEAAIAAHPKHANAHYGLANACAQLGETELYQEYIAKFQELRAGEREIAAGHRQEFDDLDSISASVAQIYTDAAKICLNQGWPAEAEILCRRAAVLDSDNADCRQALAWIRSESGRHSEAIRMLEELSRLEPDKVNYRLEIARLYGLMGRLLAAEETLLKVCEEDPENPGGHIALANVFLSQGGKQQQAIDAARAAVRVDPGVPTYLLLSTACERGGDVPEAVKAMAEVVKLAPDSIKYQQVYELLKEKQSD